MVLNIVLVEDEPQLGEAMRSGLEATGRVKVLSTCRKGEDAVALFQDPQDVPDAHGVLMDVRLEGKMNGIEAAVAIRREHPRFPVVFYSIQDDDTYFRDFRKAGILSHYAYVRKTNYLLPEMVVPLLQDAVAGRSFIDADIEARVQEVRQLDENDPMGLLEPHEQAVARMLAGGMSNDQIATQMGYKDKRTISRVNGQIYTAWGLRSEHADEKIARTRAALIVHAGRLLRWNGEGDVFSIGPEGEWVPYWPDPEGG